MKAAEIMKAMRHPVPWRVAAPRAMAVGSSERVRPDLWAAEMRFAAKGALRRRG